MKRGFVFNIAFLCIMALLLSGCGQGKTPTTIGSEVWETMPTLTYGVLESEKLQVLDWNSGRCEATSKNIFAETPAGFYCGFSSSLYYADKTKLGNWVPVCNKPNCDHTDLMTCNAVMRLSSFVIRDGRIYYEEFSNNRYRNLKQFDGGGFVLLSIAPDGTDRQFGYAIEDALLYDGGSSSTSLSSNRWMYYVEKLNTDGSTTVQLFSADKHGTVLLGEKQAEEIKYDMSLGRVSKLHGDCYYSCPNIYPDNIFRVVEGQATLLDQSLIPENGGYISGNTLRIFRQNDGYYDINLETGEEVKLADAQLEHSDGQIYLPNCIVESTLFVDAMEARIAGMSHTMKIFNGESWKNVALPSELVNAKENAYIYVTAITSNSIIFEYREKDVSTATLGKVLYQVPLDAQNLTMEYVGTIEIPKK